MNPYFPFVFLKNLRENDIKFFIKTHKPVNKTFLYLSYEDKRMMRKKSEALGCYKSPIYFSPEKTEYTSVFTLMECPSSVCGNPKNKIQLNYTLTTTNEPLFSSMTNYQKKKEFMLSLPWLSMVTFKCHDEGINNATSYPEWENVDGKNVWLLKDPRGLYLSLIDDKITLDSRDNALELIFEPFRKWPDNYYIDFPWLKCSPMIKVIQSECKDLDLGKAEKDCKMYGTNWTALDVNQKKCQSTCYYSCLDLPQPIKSPFTYSFKLDMGNSIQLGNELKSLSGNVKLLNRDDGLYLVGLEGREWMIYWKTMTGGGKLYLNQDGNLILLNRNGIAWQSETSGGNVDFVVQDTGMLEMFDGDKKIASTHLFGGDVKRLDGDVKYLKRKDPFKLQQLEELLPGDVMTSKDKSIVLYNVGRSFVITKNKHMIWNMTFNEPITISVSPEGTLDIFGLDHYQILQSFGPKGFLHYIELENNGLVIKDDQGNIVFELK